MKDFSAYRDAQSKIERAYRDKRKWAQMMLKNIANSGKFSSDRTIQEYADQIWDIKKVEVKDYI